MREIICANIGQAGIQLSTTVWELFCTEHGVQADGNLLSNDTDDYSFQAFFQEIPSGQFVPRAISVDLEPSVIDEIRAGPYRKLFHPDQLISSNEDAANNFARGHFTKGKDQIEYTINRIRKVVDMCDSLQGFFVLHSYGGGTGSGFSSLLFERLSVEFTKKTTFQVGVFPGERLSTAAVEPYNTILCSTFTIDHTDLCNMFDNESAYDICSNKLDVPRPSVSNLNRLIAQIVSSMTVSIRFEGYLNAEIDHMITNLVPYPRIHFPIFTHAPIVSCEKANHSKLSVLELTRAVFDSDNQLVNVQMEEGKYMSCCLQYRGNVTPREANDAIFEMKRRTDIRFVDWCPTGFKLGLNSRPPAYVPRSEMAATERCLTTLTNSTAISQKFISLRNKFDILFRKRSFVFWYVGEGMEEAEMQDSRDELENIIRDYDELVTDTPEQIEEKIEVNEVAQPTIEEKPTEEETEEEEGDEENEDDDDDKKTKKSSDDDDADEKESAMKSSQKTSGEQDDKEEDKKSDDKSDSETDKSETDNDDE